MRYLETMRYFVTYDQRVPNAKVSAIAGARELTGMPLATAKRLAESSVQDDIGAFIVDVDPMRASDADRVQSHWWKRPGVQSQMIHQEPTEDSIVFGSNDVRCHTTPEELAKLFHDTYERLAPSYGYETRRDSAVPWESVPARNKTLMVATCAVVLQILNSKHK